MHGSDRIPMRRWDWSGHRKAEKRVAWEGNRCEYGSIREEASESLTKVFADDLLTGRQVDWCSFSQVSCLEAAVQCGCKRYALVIASLAALHTLCQYSTIVQNGEKRLKARLSKAGLLLRSMQYQLFLASGNFFRQTRRSLLSKL